MLTDMKSSVIGADIHTHVLPGIDDGAENTDISLRLIKCEKEMGVTDIVLTPHFNMSDISLEEFLSRREASYKSLLERLKETDELSDMRFHLGAEVRYDPNLVKQPFEKLCIGNTSYLLLESTGGYPFNFENTLNFMLNRGITPILAHIERYEYLRSDIALLERLIDSGVVLQCNASSVFGKNRSSTAIKLIKKGYIDILASDCHSPALRPPNLSEAYKKLKKESDRLIKNSLKVVNDKLI